jgi:heme iron utilization protein
VDAERARALQELLRTQEVAALGTLHQGEPFVSMAPYGLLPGGALVIHVSRLATHTRDMEQHAGVSVMVLGERGPETSAQAVPRVTLQGEARVLPREDLGYEAAKQAYLARFPIAEEMFGFGDFSLYRIVPRSVRFVGGFAQAWSITGEDYARVMA